MAGNTFGSVFKVTTFGESHGEAIGAVIDGCPSGIQFDINSIQTALNRRRPGFSGVSSTSRKENDEAKVISGVFEGVTTGAPIAIVIQNTSQHSGDYSDIKTVFRPGHADYTWQAKYGIRDYRGGGRSSGRETAARVAAGAVAKMLLEQRLFSTQENIVRDSRLQNSGKLKGGAFSITAYTKAAAGISCSDIDFSVIEKNSMRAPDSVAAAAMEQKISELREKGDSAGGIVECVISGLPAGLGEPVFDKLDAELAKAMLSIGAVKGIEFGAGFASSEMTGSVMNDAMRHGESNVASNQSKSPINTLSVSPCFVTNNSGGILGGISNGNDIIFRIAIKPVPSIFLTQQTVDINGNDSDITIQGRHDVCLCPRIVPVVEAMAAMTIADMYMRRYC